MDENLCAPCARLVIKQSEIVIRLQHHESLSELKLCAESARSPCPVCQVFWAAVDQDSVVLQFKSESEPDAWNTSLRLNIWTAYNANDADRITELWLNPDRDTSVISVEVFRQEIQAPPWATRSSIVASVNISAESGSTAAQELEGRYATKSADFQDRAEIISITKGWVNDCSRHHPRCGLANAQLLPARVVDIGKGVEKPRILETQSKLSGLYVALSYAWGDADTSMLKLTKGTKKDLLSEIDLSQLILSHQHGIQVAKELGYRYIWIDALCAIQDDSNDWIGQAKLVAEIYGKADLTIVAGRTKDARDGFLAPKFTPKVPPAALKFQTLKGQPLSKCWVSLRRNKSVGHLSGRGWCFQEALVSRRQIIYGEQQLSFHCRETIRFEDGELNKIDGADSWYNLTTLSYHSQTPQLRTSSNPSSHPLETSSTNVKQSPILRRWYEMAEEYSSREFFHPSENHVALSSTVRLFQEALVKGHGVGVERYMAGLWESDMVHGLLWKSCRLKEENVPALIAPTKRRAPSWSWMALIGPIDYDLRKALSIGRWSRTLCETLCTPANSDGKTWGPEPDKWGPEMIDGDNFPDLFSLEVKTYIRRVRISRYNTKDLPYKNSVGLPQPSIVNQQTFLLEADDDDNAITGLPNASSIAGRGLFDLEYTAERPTRMWAMCVTASEGLLLNLIPNESNVYERLGVFFVEEVTAFYPPEVIKGSDSKPELIIGNLPMDKSIVIV